MELSHHLQEVGVVWEDWVERLCPSSAAPLNLSWLGGSQDELEALGI